MSCALTVVGRTFDVDRFLAQVELKPERVRHYGQPIGPALQSADVFGTSGFTLAVSERGFHDFKGQVRDAVRFLRRKRIQEALTRLKRVKGVERIELDFGIAWLDVAAQFDALPPELVSLAGRFGLWVIISHYPVGPSKLSETPLRPRSQISRPFP